MWFFRWSAIAARLPGRTDNEIKNVWHTHLKKKLKHHQSSQDLKRQSTIQISKCDNNDVMENNYDSSGKNNVTTSPQRCSSEISSVTDSSMEKIAVKEEMDYSSEYFPTIDESFWSEELPKEDVHSEANEDNVHAHIPLVESVEDSKVDGGGMDFWYNLFIKAGDMPDLPEF